jgi:hypothetical protein
MTFGQGLCYTLLTLVHSENIMLEQTMASYNNCHTCRNRGFEQVMYCKLQLIVMHPERGCLLLNLHIVTSKYFNEINKYNNNTQLLFSDMYFPDWLLDASLCSVHLPQRIIVS